MFKKILIANRGEIALRIHRACQDMGILTVAVHSTADEKSMHVRLANESVCIGPASIKDSYLNIPSIISAATIANVDAIHPGVGLLSENYSFAKIVNDHGFKFIGPNQDHISLMGNKVTAKQKAKEIGLPTLPGSEGNVENISQAVKVCKKIGFPVLIKATNGGGGRGIKKVTSMDELKQKFALTKSEALQSFGDDSVYIEKYLSNPRHIEIQVISDSHGNFLHLGERDCSIQRRNQKILEECPSPILINSQRKYISEVCIKAMRKLKYENAGTIEFLFEDNNFYFIEMNTRLQVEHPITEMITRIDLVREQISVASGEKLSFDQSRISPLGHSIECRINAEDPSTFQPSAGTISLYHPPAGNGIRLDTFIYSGYKVPHYYDNLLAKLIVTGRDRDHAIRRALRSLDEIIIEGVTTNIELHKKILSSDEFKNGSVSIKWLEENIQSI